MWVCIRISQQEWWTTFASPVSSSNCRLPLHTLQAAQGLLPEVLPELEHGAEPTLSPPASCALLSLQQPREWGAIIILILHTVQLRAAFPAAFPLQSVHKLLWKPSLHCALLQPIPILSKPLPSLPVPCATPGSLPLCDSPSIWGSCSRLPSNQTPAPCPCPSCSVPSSLSAVRISENRWWAQKGKNPTLEPLWISVSLTPNNCSYLLPVSVGCKLLETVKNLQPNRTIFDFKCNKCRAGPWAGVMV